jgi:hypothetical protein
MRSATTSAPQSAFHPASQRQSRELRVVLPHLCASLRGFPRERSPRISQLGASGTLAFVNDVERGALSDREGLCVVIL